MKKIYERPEVQVINLASMQSIAVVSHAVEEDYEGGNTSFGTGDRDFTD